MDDFWDFSLFLPHEKVSAAIGTKTGSILLIEYGEMP